MDRKTAEKWAGGPREHVEKVTKEVRRKAKRGIEGNEFARRGRDYAPGRYDTSTRGHVEYWKGEEHFAEVEDMDSFEIEPSNACLARRNPKVKEHMDDYESTGHWPTDTEPILWPKAFSTTCSIIQCKARLIRFNYTLFFLTVHEILQA